MYSQNNFVKLNDVNNHILEKKKRWKSKSKNEIDFRQIFKCSTSSTTQSQPNERFCIEIYNKRKIKFKEIKVRLK